MLTKSLHTVTAATNVARLLLDMQPNHKEPVDMALSALLVLGYSDVSLADPTMAKIVKACAALLVQS
jgi:Tfp pilus assembly pilus retraction ATPase PilT